MLDVVFGEDHARVRSQMKRFKSARQAQRFLSIHDLIANHFHLRRDHHSVADYRKVRAQAFQVWTEIASASHAQFSNSCLTPMHATPQHSPPDAA